MKSRDCREPGCRRPAVRGRTGWVSPWCDAHLLALLHRAFGPDGHQPPGVLMEEYGR